MKRARDTKGGRAWALLLAAVLAPFSTRQVPAADVDVAKLPPPAQKQIDFVRDIKPILDAACIRCHGPEKPKSGFRLDNRAAALKGGEDGVDILPGRSAESPFIHYVARLVPEMEMPPAGKGDPLTADQIGLLRAWIDQDVAWAEARPTNSVEVTFAPVMGWTFVSGNNQKFREHQWHRDGFGGGLEHFELFEQLDPDTTANITGRALVDDYRVTLQVDRREVGFVRSGWQQYRKYYDDTGGAFPSRSVQSLGQDLHLDIGKAWVDIGLTLPHWPRMVLGYEYNLKRGEEGITSWQSDGGPGEARNVRPASKHLDEGVHIIKFDLDAEVKGVVIEDRFRGEFYDLKSHYTNLAARASVGQNARQDNQYFQGANSIRLEKKFNGWLFGSGGYFYSKLNADDSFQDLTTANGGTFLANVSQIELSRESHVFNLTGLVGPFDGLTASAGVQAEWTHQDGFGSGALNGIAYTRPPGNNLMINPAVISASYDQNTVAETFGLKYTKIPFTSLFADARFRQEEIEQANNDLQPGLSFIEKPSFTSHLTDLRAGFNTSPWQNVNFSAHYRYYENESHYRTNRVPQPPDGYPGLIRSRETVTDEIQARVAVRPASWLKTTFTYQYVTTEYDQETRPASEAGTLYSSGGHVHAGDYDAHIYSVGLTLTPRGRWAVSGTFSYQDTRTATPSGGFLHPYKGDVYSALANGTYILNAITDLSLNYSFSYADYSKLDSANPNAPPPVGIRYQQHALVASITRRFTKNLSMRLQYGFYLYDEPSIGGVNDYTAHSVFATLTCRLP